MLIFDLDGTLINSELFLKTIEADLKCELGFPITLEDQLTRFGGVGPHQQLELDPSLPVEFADLAEALFRKEAKGKLEANPGVREFLSRCKGTMRVASNGPLEWIKLALEVTELAPFFDESDLFHVGQVQNKKPAPDLFLLASQDMQDRADVLVFEDSLVGVRAAVSAGLRVVVYTGSSTTPNSLKDVAIAAGAEGAIKHWREAIAFTGHVKS